MESNAKQTTEIVAFGSGKGGTGKTIIASSLGYALIRSGQRVLMVDSDPATDGLSLFLLGPKGTQQIDTFQVNETFSGVISQFTETGRLEVNPRLIHRSESGDHGLSYSAIISGRGLYGDVPESGKTPAVPGLDQASFRKAVAALFEKLRGSGQYDYILVDTRGGFAFESTDVCALADSFIVVTEPNYTSFYQDRNLVKRISAAAMDLQTRPLLRSIIVNKATEAEVGADGRLSLDNLEASFRLELEREFPVKFKDTHAVPLDIESIKAYKVQAIPYVAAPASPFSFATLSAFRDILQVVTSRWSPDQVLGWNGLIDVVSTALEARYQAIQREKTEATARVAELESLRKQVAEYQQRITSLEREASRADAQYQRELERTQALLSRLEKTEAPLSPSKVPKYEAGGSSPWSWFKGLRPRWRLVLVYLVLAIISVPGYIGWRWYEQARFEQILTSLYSPTLPPALRISYFRELRSHYHQSIFDSLDLTGLRADGASMDGVSFRSAKLINASFANTSLRQSNFSDAVLTGARFENANLTGADLERTTLSKADLKGANLLDANLLGTDLHYANLTGARVSPDQLAEALTDESTILPNGKPQAMPEPVGRDSKKPR